MKLRGPIFKHFGSKYSGAKHYPPPIPGLPLFEPYAGGAGYASNYADFDVYIWEDDAHLQKLWKWIIEEARQLDILDIPINIPVGTDIRTLGLSEGQELLLKHWQRTNNVGNCWTISPWGNKPGQWTESTRSRVAEEIHAVKHWILEPIQYSMQGTYFIDPPYYYNYRYRFKEPFDFDQLVHNVNSIPTGSRIIVCEASCPKTGKIPDYLPFEPSHTQVTSRRKKSNNHHSFELRYVENR